MASSAASGSNWARMMFASFDGLPEANSRARVGMSGLNVVLSEVPIAAQNVDPIGTRSAVADLVRNVVPTRIGRAELMVAMPALVHGQAGCRSALSAGLSAALIEIRIEAMSVQTSACLSVRSSALTTGAVTTTITTM